MTKREVLEYIMDNNGVITTSEAEENGISRMFLSRLKKEGLIVNISRGVYSLRDELPDMMYIIQKRCRKGVFSNESALYIHELTDRTPLKHVITVPSDYNASNLKELPVKFKYSKSSLIDLGKVTMKSPQGNDIYVYDIERTICDIIKNKSKIDKTIVNVALRQYADQRRNRFSILMLYARKLGVEKKVLETMGVLL